MIDLAIADSNVLLIGELLSEEISSLGADYICEYKSNTKQFLLSLGEFLGFSPEKATIEAYKGAIAESASGQIVVIENGQRLPLSLRFWLADIDLKFIFQCPSHPKKDIFLDCVAIDIPPLSPSEATNLIEIEAAAIGLGLSSRRLQALAINCTSPSAARVIVRREKLGLDHDFKHLPGEYLDISPLLMAGLAGFGILRFVGLGMGDRTLYIVGGTAMMIGLTFKYLGRFGKR